MSTLDIVVSFILVTVAGNYLASAWQYRTWVRQKRFERKTSSISSLQSMFDEMTSIMSGRRYAMLKIVYAIRSKDEGRINSCLEAYQRSLDDWNTKFNYILIKVIFELGVEEMKNLEDYIGCEFVKIGSDIELCIRNQSNATKSRLNDIENRLNLLNREIININRDVYRKIAQLEKSELFAEEKTLGAKEYEEAPTWALFRNLFKARI